MRLRLLASLLVLAGCTSSVPPTNPYDPATPPDHQAKAALRGTLQTSLFASKAGFQVGLRRAGLPMSPTLAEADGSFVFDALVPGDYSLEPSPAGFTPLSIPLHLAPGQDLDVGAVELVPLSGASAASITGRVVLGAGAADLSGTLVEAVGSAFTAITNSLGQYSLSVIPGDYQLRFTHQDYLPATLQAVTVSAGEQRELVDPVTLDFNPAVLQGHVDGELAGGGLAGLAGATVTLDGTAYDAVTGPTGDFTVLAPSGSYLLRVLKPGYADVTVAVLQVVAGEHRTLEALTVTLSRGSLAGAVALADSGDASGAVVEVTGAKVAAVTGSDGAFRFDGLTEGVYEVTARRDGYGRAVATSLTVRAGQATPVPTLTLARQGGSVSVDEGPFTREPVIHLSLGAAGVTHYRASLDPAYGDAALGDLATDWHAFTTGTPVAFTLPGADGAKAVWVTFSTGGADPGAPIATTVVLDRQAPARPVLTLGDGSGWSRAQGGVLSLAIAAQDLPAVAGAAVSGLDRSWIANGADCTPGGLTPRAFNGSEAWTVASPGQDGPKEVAVCVVDRAGNVSPAATATITVDTQPPTAPGLSLSGGDPAHPTFTTSPLVTATLAADDLNAGAGGSGLQVRLSNAAGMAGARYQPFASSLTWILSTGDGDKTVWAQFMDPAGNETAAIPATITLETSGPTAPAVTLVEQDAAQNGATNNRVVGLVLQALGNPVSALVAENPALSGATAVDLLTQPASLAQPYLFTLADADGTHTLWVRFLDAAGNASEPAAAAVVLDRSPPLASPPAVSPQPFTSGSTIALTPPSAGQDELQVAGPGVVPLAWTAAPAGVPVLVSLAGGNGARAFTVSYRDRAGNVTPLAPQQVVVDTVAPAAVPFAVTGTLGGGLASSIRTATRSVTLDLTGQDDATSGIVEVQLSNDAGFAGAAWQPYVKSAAVPWLLGPGDGPKTVHARFRDAVGLVSATAQGHIDLREAAPSGGSLVIEGGARTTSKSRLALAVRATGATQMRFTVDGGLPGPWLDYATDAAVDLLPDPAEGTRTVDVTFRNAAEVEGAGVTAAIFYDRRAPAAPGVAVTGTLADSATSSTYAASPIVVARLAWSAADVTVAEMTLFESPTCALPASPVWQPLASAATFVFSAGDGDRRLCAALRDEAGNAGDGAGAAITLDTAAPANPVFTDLASRLTNQPAVTGTVSPPPAPSGTSVGYQCLGAQFGPDWTDCTPDGARRVAYALSRNQDNVLGIRTRDLARNASPGSLVTVTHDDVAPVPPAVTGLRTTASTVLLEWAPSTSPDVASYRVLYGTAPGEGSGVEADQGVSPVPVGAATSAQLSGLSPGTTYYVSVLAVDAAGNVGEPGGEQAASPNQVSPRFLAAYGARFESVGARTDGATRRAYLGQRQGLVQLDVTDPSKPVLLGRAAMPGVAPLNTSPIVVVGCRHEGVAGDCVYVAGTSLEADYRNDPTLYRSSVAVFFFPAVPAAGGTSLGVAVASLHARADYLVPSDDGLVLYAVERTQVRAYSLADPVSPWLLGPPAPLLDGAGLPVTARKVHGAGVVAGPAGPVLAVLATPQTGNPTLYAFDAAVPSVLGASAGVELQNDFGAPLTSLPNWTYYAPTPAEPVAAFFGALHAGYVHIDRTAMTWATDVGTWDLAGARFPRPERVLRLAAGALEATYMTPDVLFASNRGASPGAADGRFYAFTYKPLVYDATGQVLARRLVDGPGGLAETLSATLPVMGSSARAVGATSDGETDGILAADGATLVQVDAATTAGAGQVVHAEYAIETFTAGQQWLVARGASASTLNVLDVSNPTVPVLASTYQGGASYYLPVKMHAGLVYAGTLSTIDLLDLSADGRLTHLGTAASTNQVRGFDLAGGRLVMAAGNAVELWDVTTPTAPVRLATRALSAYDVSLRGQLAFVATGSTLQVLSIAGDVLTPVGSAAVGGGTVTVRGTTAVVGSNTGTVVVDVTDPAAPVVEPTIYGMAGPASLHAGYLVGQSRSGSAPATLPTPPPESGPRFHARGGTFHGAQPFAGCGAAASYYTTNLVAEGSVYYAACNLNGINLSTPANPVGGSVRSEQSVTTFGQAQYVLSAGLATDGNTAFLSCLSDAVTPANWAWNADTQRLAAGEAAPLGKVMAVYGPPSSPSAGYPVQLAAADGVLFAVQTGGTRPALVVYDPTAWDGTRTTWVRRGDVALSPTFTYGSLSTVSPVTDGDTLYGVVEDTLAASSNVLFAVDVRAHGAPVSLPGVTGAAGEKFSGLALYRRRLYAGSTGPATSARVRIWDAAAPAALVERTPVDLQALTPVKAVRDVAVFGRWLVATYEGQVGRTPYGMALVRLGPAGDGAGATLVGTWESPLPLGNPTQAGDLLYLRHNLGLATFDLAPLFRAEGFPAYLGSRRTNEALFWQSPAKLVVDGPWAYLLGGNSFRIFDLR